MGQEYPMEIVEKAEQLWCVDGHTFEAVATLTGVAPSTLKRWSERYNWPDKREKIRLALSSIRTNTVMLRARLIENCLTTLNAQDAFAVSALEGVAQRAAEIAAKSQSATVQPPLESLREIHTEADAVIALEEAVQLRLNSLLTNPGQISLAAIKDIKQVYDLLRDLKAGQAARDNSSKDDRSGGLSEDTIRKIEEQVLGITR